MTWYFSYIGDGEDPDFALNTEGTAFLAGRLPRRITPIEKSRSLGVGLSLIRKMIEEEGFSGGAIDWGAWGVVLTGQQLNEVFQSNPEIMLELSILEPDYRYILVAAEGA